MVLKSALDRVQTVLSPNRGSADSATKAIDVLVIGGGVQGLTLLDRLTDRGYAAAIVTNSPVGQGQSLHWHGVLSRGYTDPRPEIRESVVEDWLPYLNDLGIETYGNSDWYVLATQKPYQHLTDAWDSEGYPYQEGTTAQLPEEYRDNDLFGHEAESHVLEIDEYCLDKQELVHSLLAGHENRIVVGDITGYEFRAGATPAVEAVEITTRTDSTIRLQPDYAIAAVGTGTHGLFDSLVSSERFQAAGGDPARIRESLQPVTYRNVHMLTIRGPAAVMPEINAYVPSKKMKVVTHRHNRDGEEFVTCYVTNKPLSAVEPKDSPDDGRGAVDPDHVTEGFNTFFSVVPAIRRKAAREGAGIEFCVYAGVKQFIGDTPNAPHAQPVEGLANVSLALPSVMAGVQLTTERTIDDVTAVIEPSGECEQVPGGGNPPIGTVTEQSDDIEWLNWSALIEAYPGIDHTAVQER